MAASVERIHPGRGRAGDTVTITGSGFGSANLVSMDGSPLPGPSVLTLDPQTIRATIPAGLPADRHVEVAVLNLDDGTEAGWWWWSKPPAATILGTRIPLKLPGHSELAEGDVELVDAFDLERLAQLAELLPFGLLTAKGALAVRLLEGGMRQVLPGPDGTRLVRDEEGGGAFLDRRTFTLSWGLEVPASAVTDTLLAAHAVDTTAPGGSEGTELTVPVSGRVVLLSLFCRASTSSRIVQAKVLANGTEAWDSADLGLGNLPFIRGGDVWSAATWLQVSQGDRLEIAVRKNTTSTAANLLATIQVM